MPDLEEGIKLGEDGSAEVDLPIKEDGIDEELTKDMDEEEKDFANRSKKFKNIYAKWKRAERELEGLGKQNLENDKLIKEMQKHNKDLVKAIQSSVKQIASGRSGDSEEAEIEGKLSEIDTSIKDLIKIKSEAMRAEDYEKVATVDEQLAELRDAKKEYKAAKQTKKESKDSDYVDTTPFDNFISKAPWYNEDPLMKVAAKELDKILANDEKWGEVSIDERLEEVRNRIEKRFGYVPKVEKDNGKKPPAGEGGGPLRGKEAGGKMKLSAEELKVATKFGMTPSEYAEQKMLIERGQ